MTTDQVTAQVAQLYQVTPAAIRSRRRTPRVSEARAIAYWVLVHGLEWTGPEVATAFGRHVSSVNRQVAIVQSRRRFSDRLRTRTDKLAKQAAEAEELAVNNWCVSA